VTRKITSFSRLFTRGLQTIGERRAEPPMREILPRRVIDTLASNRVGTRIGNGCLEWIRSRPNVLRETPQSIAGAATTTGPTRFGRTGLRASPSSP